MTRVLTWSRSMKPLGRTAVAIGVFDGVHRGHRALLDSAARSARRHDCLSVALTFDRDPDQVIHPEAAMPALMTLEQRTETLASTGVDVVLVVPFTAELAATEPEAFLDTVLGVCCNAVEIHVGHDFRFGAHASGNLDTLYVWGVEHGAEVTGHDLLEHEEQPITSTRIRRLVAHGEIDMAYELMGGRPTLTGMVHHGRGQGTSIGFATANVVPVAHAAIPADGVYAGIARLADGSRWPAAISVGTPPTFPEARDYVEAHLIGFTGDIYELPITLEFVDRLREQQAFPNTEALHAAIADDVERTVDLVSDLVPLPATDMAAIWTDDVVEDPIALAEAEAAVASIDDDVDYSSFDESWICVYGPSRMASLISDGGARAALITGPLTAAGIPFVWDPFPPSQVQRARPDFNWHHAFRLLVPSEFAEEARSLLPDGPEGA